MSMKFGKVSKTKDLNEYDDVRIVGKTFPHDEAGSEVNILTGSSFGIARFLKQQNINRNLE